MMDLTVISIRTIADDIKCLDLARERGILPTFGAGAHIDIDVSRGASTRQLRQYSLIGDFNRNDRYRIAVLREQDGKGGSRFIHDEVAVGSKLRCSQPKNNFPLVDDARGHLLIAGGIGITPIFAMAQAIAINGGDFEVHYSARTAERMAFRAELSHLCGERAKFYLDGGEPARGISLSSILNPPRDGWHVYVCGPAGMIENSRKIAISSGYDEANVHFEAFTPEVRRSGNTAFSVVASKSGRSLMVGAGETLLEALLRSGIDAPFGCRQGECGACAIGVISGLIDHRDNFLSDDEKATGKSICTCVSRSAGSGLVLDI